LENIQQTDRTRDGQSDRPTAVTRKTVPPAGNQGLVLSSSSRSSSSSSSSSSLFAVCRLIKHLAKRRQGSVRGLQQQQHSDSRAVIKSHLKTQFSAVTWTSLWHLSSGRFSDFVSHLIRSLYGARLLAQPD